MDGWQIEGKMQIPDISNEGRCGCWEVVKGSGGGG